MIVEGDVHCCQRVVHLPCGMIILVGRTSRTIRVVVCQNNGYRFSLECNLNDTAHID